MPQNRPTPDEPLTPGAARLGAPERAVALELARWLDSRFPARVRDVRLFGSDALLALGLYADCISRGYYAAFHLARALPLSRGVEPTTRNVRVRVR